MARGTSLAALFPSAVRPVHDDMADPLFRVPGGWKKAGEIPGFFGGCVVN